MFGLTQMTYQVQGIFYLVALVLFVLAAIGVAADRINLLALGLACAAFVSMWVAFAAA